MLRSFREYAINAFKPYVRNNFVPVFQSTRALSSVSVREALGWFEGSNYSNAQRDPLGQFFDEPTPPKETCKKNSPTTITSDPSAKQTRTSAKQAEEKRIRDEEAVCVS